MNNKHLISCQKIKDNSPLYLSLEDKLIENNIILVQDTELERLLGTDLLQKIYTLAPTWTGTTTTTTVYTTLLTEYIQPFLLYSVIKHSLNSIHFKIANKGVVTNNDDNSTGVDLSSLRYYNSIYAEYSTIFADKIRKYLMENINSYPEYTTNSGYDHVFPNTSNQVKSPFEYTDKNYNPRNTYGYEGGKYI